MLVRLLRIENADLTIFEFDFDLTWAAFLMNANERIYGRFGGRDATDSEARLSLAGLRYAMQQALTTHQINPNAKPAKREAADFIRKYPAAKNYGGCIHCHQVKEIRRAELKRTNKWDRNERWVYPLPENVGITLDKDRGDLVRKVLAKSPAEEAGIKPGDILEQLHGMPVHSFADAQYALHYAPKSGSIKATWRRGNNIKSGKFVLRDGWRKTNLTWRPSLLDLFPSLPLFGEDLTAKAKTKLGLSARRLAFRQEDVVPAYAREAGIRPGDVIIGIDNKQLNMDVIEFLGYVRRNYLIGDKVTLNVIRDKKKADVPLTLR